MYVIFYLIAVLSVSLGWFVVMFFTDILPLDENNRMLRAGFGFHKGKFFIRFDLWWFGIRFAEKLVI